MQKLTIENKIQNLDKVAAFIEKFGEDNELSPKLVFELNLILDELVTNTISYGYKDDGSHTIEIIVEKDADQIKIEVRDDAEEFNPLLKEEVNLETPLQGKRIGGLGIHLIKEKADNISYERKDGKNILQLIKKLNGEKNGN